MLQNSKISVCMITYNHEKFIEEAINGVLMQNCNFEIELIIANDCSLDNTDKEIKQIIDKHAKRGCIKYTRHSKNIGMMPNFNWALQQCNGKYIALCEGDDYWTDPLKLQKQVDFLEGNEDYVLCFHNATVIDESEKIISNSLLTRIPNNGYTQKEIFEGNVIPTATVLFRNCLGDLPEMFKNIFNGDTFLFSLLAEYGNAKYLKNVKNSCYRLHDSGVWSVLTEYERLTRGTNTYLKLINSLKNENKIVVAKVAYEKKKALFNIHKKERKYISMCLDLIVISRLKLKYKL